MKNRLVRVRELLQRELGAILARDHAFPGVLVTVSDVDITPDLKHAYVYIGVIGPEHKAERVVETLNHQHGELQSRVAKRVVLKNTPRFHFRLDRSVERGVRVTQLLDTIDQQLAESANPEAEETQAVSDDTELLHDAGDKLDDEEAADKETKAPAPLPRRRPRQFAERDED